MPLPAVMAQDNVIVPQGVESGACGMGQAWPHLTTYTPSTPPERLRTLLFGREPRADMRMAERILETCTPLHRLVILLAASNEYEPIRGRAKLQKMVFMLTHIKCWEDGPCGYDAGMYGPHSDIVDEEAGYLEDVGILCTDRRNISVTRLGRKVAGRIAAGEDRRTLSRIGVYKDMFNDMTAGELLTYVYSTYPDMATRSPAYDRTMSNAERHVMSMLRKGKIALGRAAELLDCHVEDILRMSGRMRTQGEVATPEGV